jgi:DMSO/TMAO reductase YedYZ molybdopterin-dependent catalytic subunit
MNERRKFLRRGLGAIAGVALAGCDALSETATFKGAFEGVEAFTLGAQRAIGRTALAREFSEADISRSFKANGSTNPPDEDYRQLVASGFAGWRLAVDGLVEQPLQVSLAELRALPSRTQITRHDCVEGWSCIGKWKGVPLGSLLERARLQPAARYIVFHCADTLDEENEVQYYESIDLVDAFHPQTIAAYEMNGKPLPVEFGAPIRMRIERQLGYKHAKYVMRIEAAESLADYGEGKGGYWEDRGYEWYAGI